MLSHGSGASALALDWLGHRLAERGYVAVASIIMGIQRQKPADRKGFSAFGNAHEISLRCWISLHG
jgi:predicted dienelactone hydrolase